MPTLKSVSAVLRSQKRKLKGIGLATLLLSPLIVVAAPASAQSSFTDHLWKFATASASSKTIDFSKGGSKIYENGSLHVATNGRLYLDAPSRVVVSNDLTVGSTLRLYRSGSNLGNSRIYENGQLHVATDDHLYLDASSDVNVSSDLNVGGNLNTGAGNMYTDSVNHNCEVDGEDMQGCVSLDDQTNAVWEFNNKNEGVDSESSGISLNDDSINLWSPGDNSILKIYDQDNFCDGCLLGHVGDTEEGTVAATFEIDDGGTVTTQGDFVSTEGTFVGDGSGLTNLNVIADNLDSLTLDSPEVAFTGDISANSMSVLNGDWSNSAFQVKDTDGTSLIVVDTACGELEGYSCIGINSGNTGGELDVNANVYVDGVTNLNDDVSLGDSSGDNIYVNGRLYGNDGDPVTVGHFSDESYDGFKVWGNTDLRGDLSVGGWGTNSNNNVVFDAQSNCGYDDNVGGCITLGGDSWDGIVSVNGRLYGSFNGEGYDPLTVGHHGDYSNSGLLVWGESQLAGGVTIGKTWDNADLTVNGESQFNDDAYFDGDVTLNYSHLYFNYGCGGGCDQWNMYANSDSNNFILNNLNTATDVLAVTEGGDVTITGASRHATLTLANDGDLNVQGHTTLGSSHWDNLDVNATSTFWNDATVGCDGECNQANLTVNGDVTLGVDDGNDIVLNGRLYGWDGDPVTIGHHSDTSGLKVWGDTDLRGDLTVGGWGAEDAELNVLGNVTLGTDSDNSIVLNGRLYGWDGDPVTIGHFSDPSGLKVWGDSDLRGNLTVGGWGSDGTGIDVDSGNLNVNDGNLFVNGSSEVDGTAYFYGTVNVNDGNLAINNGNNLVINDNGDLVVTGDASVDGTFTVGNLTVTGAMTYGGTVVYNGGTTFNGGATYNGSLNMVGAATFNNTATFNSTVTAGSSANINFSGANMLRIPVVTVSITDGSTVCTNTGQTEFNTTDSHFYGCDGAHWQQLD